MLCDKLLLVFLFVVHTCGADKADVNPTSNIECEPIQSHLTAKKTGQKAWDKCLEYQEKLVYPCEGTKDGGRSDHCHHDEEIVGGLNATENEFPHMAMLGFGPSSKINWLCGATLISDRFLVTVGYCAASPSDGPVAYAYIGAYRRSELTDDSKLYGIKNVIKHPEYKPPSTYNNIALLETDRTVVLNQFTVPACLHIGDNVADEKVLANTWRYDDQKENPFSDTLQKVVLKKITDEECSQKYPPSRQSRKGVDIQTQVCYGAQTMFEDTCVGDGGNALLVKSKQIHCMYVITGLTMIGVRCGYPDKPGLYSRISPYVGWIESVVWP